MVKIIVNEIVVCLLFVLTGCNSSYLKTFDELIAEPTDLPPLEFTVSPDWSSTTATMEEVETEAPEIHLAQSESTNSYETQPIELHNGPVFRLMMTVVTKWNDDFMERTSPLFNKLASELGSELMDFIDNSQEESEINVTNFKLVEVLPSKDSSEKVYVTLVVLSKKDFNGEDLSNAISSRIISHGGIYEYKATIEGFVLENISREEAQDYDEEKTACDLENLTELPLAVMNAASHYVADSHKQQHLKCNREKIQRGSTSIYIMESNQECMDSVRKNTIPKKSDDVDTSDLHGEDSDVQSEDNQCLRNFKRSATEEDETVVVIKKRGNKVFIEI